MNKIRFIGAYDVKVSENEYRIAMSSGADAEMVENELSTLALVEIEVSDASRDFRLDLFHQPHTEFAPYDETYYDSVSLKELGWDKPQVANFRVAFYLHDFDANQPITTPWGEIACKEKESPPKYLKNKNYMYSR